MKAAIVLLSLLVVSGASAQLSETTGDMQSGPSARPKSAFDRFFSPVPPAEVQRGRLSYSGVFVQAFMMKNPLQLINPLAPAAAGQSEFNVARDTITRRSCGLKLFSITF